MRTFILLFSICFGLASAFAQANVDAQTQRLHAAARSGDLKKLNQVLDARADPDLRNSRGETALLIAVEAGRDRIAQALIARGADINAQAANKDTPWLLAGARGRRAMLDMMLPRGPDYKLLNRFGGTALTPACHYGHVETVRFLVRKSQIDINQINHLGWSCLLEAVILGDGGTAHQEIVRIVLRAGADPNIADKDGVTPLAHARRRGFPELARLIAAYGGK